MVQALDGRGCERDDQDIRMDVVGDEDDRTEFEEDERLFFVLTAGRREELRRDQRCG